MGSMSFSHMVLLLIVVLVVFGAGKLPRVMGDIAKGVKAFKEGIREGEDETRIAALPEDKNRAA